VPQTDQTVSSTTDPGPQARPVAVKAPDAGRQGQQTKAKTTTKTKTKTKTTLDDSASGAQAVGKHSQKTSPGSTSNTAVRSGAGKHRADNRLRSGGSSAKKQGTGGGAAGASSHHSGGSHRKDGASRHHTGAKSAK